MGKGTRKHMVKCPYCGHETKTTIRKSDKEFRCPGCRRLIMIKDIIKEVKDGT